MAWSMLKNDIPIAIESGKFKFPREYGAKDWNVTSEFMELNSLFIKQG